MDFNSKGYLTCEDVLTAIYSIGFEPTDKEWQKVETEIKLERLRRYNIVKTTSSKTDNNNNENPLPTAYPSAVNLFLKYECTFENVSECLSHWRFHATTPRPDQFQFVNRWPYFFKRFYWSIIPFGKSKKVWLDRFIPSYTEYEKGIHNTTAVLYVASERTKTRSERRKRGVSDGSEERANEYEERSDE